MTYGFRLHAPMVALVFTLAALSVSGCAYTPPKEGPTATISFVYFESGWLQGTVSAHYYRDGKRPLLGAPLIAGVKPTTPEKLEQALQDSNVIPADGQDFVFMFMYQAMSGLMSYHCEVELRFRPEPGVKYVGVVKTTDRRCGGGVMRQTATGFETEPTAKMAFGDRPQAPPEPTEPLASEHTPKPNLWW